MWQAFLDKNSPVYLQSPRRVHKYLQSSGLSKITLAEVNAFEKQHVRANQIIRSRKKVFKRLTTRANGLNDQWQLDLVDLHSNIVGNKFLLTKVDVFSRQGDAEVVGDKSGPKVLAAFKRILARSTGYPMKIQTDDGKEFYNSHFKIFCKQHNIYHFSTKSEMKAAMVEIFNKTMQKSMYRMRSQDKLSWKESAQRAVDIYNKLPHSHFGEVLAPADITLQNHTLVADALLSHDIVQAQENRRKSLPFRFKVGDNVRLAVEHKSILRDKSYRGTFTKEGFIVTRRFRRFPDLNINLYNVKDKRDESIDGVFYENQLSAFTPPKSPVVEKVIRKDKKSGKRLVTFQDYPSDYQIWQDARAGQRR